MIPGFLGVITFVILERISFLMTPFVIAQSDEVVKIRIFATIPIDHPLGMTTYHKGFLLITIPLTLWNKVKTMTCPFRLNMFLCKELERQELAAQKQAEAEHKKEAAEHKKAEVALKKKEASKKRSQDKQDALKKEREERRKACLQKKEKFKKKAPTLKTKSVLLDLRLQCRILLERSMILRSKYETYDFLGKRPRTSLSMLIFNLQRALETGQPLQRFINSASKHLQRLCPRRRVVSAQ